MSVDCLVQFLIPTVKHYMSYSWHAVLRTGHVCTIAIEHTILGPAGPLGIWIIMWLQLVSSLRPQPHTQHHAQRPYLQKYPPYFFPCYNGQDIMVICNIAISYFAIRATCKDCTYAQVYDLELHQLMNLLITLEGLTQGCMIMHAPLDLFQKVGNSKPILFLFTHQSCYLHQV